MSRENRIFVIVFILFTFLSLLLFWRIFLGKVNLNGNLLVSFYAPYGENLPFKNTGWDQLRIYFPFLKITLDSIKNWQTPLWNPYTFAGHPHLADFQSAVFYPLNIFGLVLGQIEFWHLLRITPTILASFFTFLYLRSLRLVNLAAILGALTFGFSPFILTWGEEVVMSPHSVVWLPLVLYAIEKFLASRQKKFLAVCSLALVFSLFGGYLQTTIYLFLFVFAYLLFRLGRGLFLRIEGRLVAATIILGILIASVQLFPSAELYFNSARASVTLRETLLRFLLPPQTLLTYLAPDFFGHPATGNFFRGGQAQYYEGILFGGIAAAIFAIWAIWQKGKDKLVKFLTIFGLVTLSTTFDLPTSRFFLSLPIPFLSTSIANRVLFMPAFCLAVLAAIGFDLWLKKGDRKILRVIWPLAVILILSLVYSFSAHFWGWPYFSGPKIPPEVASWITFRNLVIPSVVLSVTTLLIVVSSNKKWRSVLAAAIILVAYLHIFYFSGKYFSFSRREYIFPKNPVLDFIAQNQGYFRSWGIGEAFLENNFSSQYAIFWPEGYDSLNNRDYSEFTYAMQGNRLADYVFRADAGLGRGKTDELLENARRRRLIDLVGVKYVIAQKDDGPLLQSNNFKMVFDPPSHEASTLRSRATAEDGSEGKDFAVFENLQVLPRAFLASNYEGPPHLEDSGQVLNQNSTDLSVKERDKARRKLIFQKLLDPDFNFRDVLILEKPSPISAQFGKGSVEIVSYEPQEVVVRTKSDQPKLLFLADNYYPGWKATVDGEDTKILRADYTFRAVPLIPGEHIVRFYYDSWVLKAGALVSLTSLLALIFGLYFKNLI